MDNVIRLSKFVKNLGIVTTVLFLIIVLVTFVTGNMGVSICFMPFVFLGIALILAYKKQIIVVNEDEIVFSYLVRFLYKGIIIKHNKTEPTYTKTSLFLCEKRRFLWPGLRKEGNLFKLAGPGGLAFFHLTKKEVSKWPMKK